MYELKITTKSGTEFTVKMSLREELRSIIDQEDNMK